MLLNNGCYRWVGTNATDESSRKEVPIVDASVSALAHLRWNEALEAALMRWMEPRDAEAAKPHNPN